MRKALALASIVLAVPAAARAHVEPKPPFVTAAADTTVSLETPNERESATMTELVVEAPPDVRIVGASAPAGWTQSYSARRATFSGGRLASGDSLAFEATLRAETTGTATLHAVQRFDDGGEVPWDVGLSVLPASATSAPPQHPERAVIAALAGIALVALSLLAVHRLRRRSLQET